MQNFKTFSPAFPPFPSADNFGRPVALFPGMTLLDYAAIQIYSQNAADLSPAEAVNLALSLISELYEKQSNKLLDEDNVITTV